MSLHQRDMLEISELASAAADGRLSAGEGARLEEILKNSAEAREYYVRFMGISAELAWAGQASSPAKSPQALPRGAAPRRRQWWIGAAAAAAVVVMAFAAGFSLFRAPPKVDNGSAVLVDDYNAVWEGGQRPARLMDPGTLSLTGGLARIQFSKGTNVWLEGPVVFEVRSPTEGFLRAGKVLVNVPAEAHGFRIGSPAVTVTDRGTGFGLDVRDNQTAVHVFKGEVDLNVGGKTSALGEGEARLVDSAGGLKEIRCDLRGFDRPGFIQHDMTAPDWAPASFGRGGPHRDGRDHGGPLEVVREQLDVTPDRWYELMPRLMDISRLQWDLQNPGGPVTLASSMELWRVTFDPQSSEDEIRKALKGYRDAHETARQNLEAAEKELQASVNTREESVLVTFGFLH
ncbi:MAG TPA: FecR family protein [Phycisphaerae bacterium]|nr:FecR family protein [Phycisphaerae bacterium]